MPLLRRIQNERAKLSFVEKAEMKALPVREAILSHPFIVGVGEGTLPVEKFKYYVMQDYVYLIDYSRVLALASARAPDLEIMGWFAGLLDETLNTEMDLHRSYCAEFGITRAGAGSHSSRTHHHRLHQLSVDDCPSS